ncbi:MAG: response regulator [Opitutaceae bacterium]|nr:response regulator [Opitutaceae bacterium]
MKNRILCVDDDANILAGLQRNLRKRFALDTAVGGEQALLHLETHGPYAVVVADMQMPGMNGIQFLTEVERRAPETVRVMLTGNADQRTAMAAVNEGHVFRFLTKPCSLDALTSTLEAALGQYRLVTAERELLERTLNGTIKVLCDILSILDPAAFGLGQTLRDCMRDYARHVKIAQSWDLELAAMVSLVGYVTIPAPILHRFRAGLALKPEEKTMLARVPLVGSELLVNIPRLEEVARIVLYQNKNFDGTGMPHDSCAGKDIPAGARVLRVLTDLLALEAGGISRPRAFAELRTRRGAYDPDILEAVSSCYHVSDPAVGAPLDSEHEVTLAGLCVGHLLVANIETIEGVMLVSAGTVVTPVILEKLRNFATVIGIQEPFRVETDSPRAGRTGTAATPAEAAR